jgi:Rab GDP dissociation inhibitor
VFCCSHSHNVAPKGKYIAFVSAEVETENPESELEPGLALLGHIDEKIIDMYDMYEPVNDSSLDNCFISKVLIHLTFAFDTLTILLWFRSSETLQSITS